MLTKTKYLVAELTGKQGQYRNFVIVEDDATVAGIYHAQRAYGKQYGTAYGMAVGIVLDEERVKKHIEDGDHVFAMFLSKSITYIPAVGVSYA